MSDAYDSLEKRAKASIGDGKYVQLKSDGDFAVVLFVGNPAGEDLWWDPAAKKYIPYTEQHAKEGKKVTFRVKHNVVVIAEGNGDKRNELPTPKVKILEMSATVFTAFMKVKKKYGLEKYFEIQRSGDKGDSNVQYTILVDGQEFTEEDAEVVKTLTLHNLEDGSSGEEGFDSYDKGDDADATISKEEMDQLVKPLKAFPREKLNEFLSKFGIGKIKELKKKDFKSALAFVNGEDEPAAEAEEDPFA